jgi:hypothetical protein
MLCRGWNVFHILLTVCSVARHVFLAAIFCRLYNVISLRLVEPEALVDSEPVLRLFVKKLKKQRPRQHRK